MIRDPKRPFFRVKGTARARVVKKPTQVRGDDGRLVRVEGPMSVSIDSASDWPDLTSGNPILPDFVYPGTAAITIISEGVRDFVLEHCDPEQVPMYPVEFLSAPSISGNGPTPRNYVYICPGRGLDADPIGDRRKPGA